MFPAAIGESCSGLFRSVVALFVAGPGSGSDSSVSSILLLFLFCRRVGSFSVVLAVGSGFSVSDRIVYLLGADKSLS